MKKITLLFLLLTFGIGFGQIKIENEKFYTTLKNGDGSISEITFNVKNEVQDFIKTTDKYKRFLNDTEFIKSISEKEKKSDTLAIYLYSEVNYYSFATKNKLQNKASYKIVNGGEGNIRVSDNVVKYSFPITAKNNIGNELSKTSLNYGDKTLLLD